jgi:hypothetical protein
MKFFFLHGKKSKAIYGEPTGMLGKAAASFDWVKPWCQSFKQGNFSLDDDHRPARPLHDNGEVASEFLKKAISFSTCPREESCGKKLHYRKVSHAIFE